MSDGESYHASDCESAEQADSTQNNPTDESAQKKTEPNISSGSSASTSSLAPAASNEQEAREKRKEGREEITLKLEIAGFFIGIIVGGIFLFQSCEMWKATNAATDQLAEMQRSREEDERAWVGISSIKPIFEEGSITGFQMNYKNTGKTPALNCEMIFAETVFPEIIPTQEGKPNPLQNKGMLAPEAEFVMGNMESPVPAGIIQDAMGGKKPLFIYGTIWYDDIFGTNHWCQFCYKAVGNGSGKFEIDATGFHNGTDDTYTNQSN